MTQPGIIQTAAITPMAEPPTALLNHTDARIECVDMRVEFIFLRVCESCKTTLSYCAETPQCNQSERLAWNRGVGLNKALLDTLATSALAASATVAAARKGVPARVGEPQHTAAQKYLRTLFVDGDIVCIQLIHATETYIGKDGKPHAKTQSFFQPLEQVSDDESMRQLQQFNDEGWNIYVCMNPFKEQVGKAHRTKIMVENVRSAYLDIDKNGDAQRKAILIDGSCGELPVPHFILNSSPHKYQIVWLTRDMSPNEQEALNKVLQRKYESDPQATDVVRVLRLPTFKNLKYEAQPIVGIEAPGDGPRYSLGDFGVDISTTLRKTVPMGEALAPEKILKRGGVIEAAMAEAGIDFTDMQETGKGDWKWQWTITCPNAEEHESAGDTAAVALARDGKIGFSCFHAHCGGRDWTSYMRPLLEQKVGRRLVFEESNVLIAGKQTTSYTLNQKMEEAVAAVKTIIVPQLSLISAHIRGGGSTVSPNNVLVVLPGAERDNLILSPSAMTSTRLGDIYNDIFAPCGIPLEMALPALFTAASVRVPNGVGDSDLVVGDDLMSNLYTALIGPVGGGKSQVIEWACKALNIYKADRAPHYMESKFPSTERMLIYLKKNLKSFGTNFLINPDEWSYLFQKNRVTGSSFPQFMTTSYYRRRQTFPLAGRAGELILNNAISYIGGVVDDEFDMLFDASTLGGLYDRFFFGLREGWKMDYRPYPRGLELHDNWDTSVVARDGSVFEVVKKWNQENPSRGRIVEIMIRVAVIAASLDGRSLITGRDIENLAGLADNQAAIRGMYSPNVGQLPEAKFQHAILNWLKSHAGDGRWVPISTVKKGVHVYEMSLGPSVAERTLGAMARGSGLVDVYLPRLKSNGEFESAPPKDWGDGRVPVLGIIRLSKID